MSQDVINLEYQIMHTYISKITVIHNKQQQLGLKCAYAQFRHFKKL